jgi:citrate lyase beta subunit
MSILKLVEILRAAKILHQMKVAHASQKGAIGLDGEMIDAPMIKQVRVLLSLPAAHRFLNKGNCRLRRL